jgi:hypothetical protein
MKAFLGQLKELEDKLEQIQPIILEEVADFLVIASPDDTGAYILSHSIGRSGNVGGSISSHGRQSAPDMHREAARQKLISQVWSIPPNQTRVWVGNNTPHASIVEYGWPTKEGYAVYQKLGVVFSALVENAKNRVGLK